MKLLFFNCKENLQDLAEKCVYGKNCVFVLYQKVSLRQFLVL